MQSIYLPRCFWNAWNNSFFHTHEPSVDAQRRLKGLLLWKRLRMRGMASHDALSEVIFTHGHSRDYWYRWRTRFQSYGKAGLEMKDRRPKRIRKKEWDQRVLDRIVSLRKEQKTCRWGREKIFFQLSREGYDPPSISTVGRMIKYLKQKKRIRMPLGVRLRRQKQKKQRPYAKRYTPKKHKNMLRVQIDDDFYRMNGMVFYNFSAIHTASRWIWARAYPSQTARNAFHFLEHILATQPQGCHIDAIQVDGGSEFMKEFEQHCQTEELPLLVNRPKTPEQNAFVERLHRTIDEEFYQVVPLPDTFTEINTALTEWVDFYNTERPHWGIGMMIPCQKLAELHRMEELRMADVV